MRSRPSNICTLKLTRLTVRRLNDLFARNILVDANDTRVTLKLVEWPRESGELDLSMSLYAIVEVEKDKFGIPLIEMEK